MDIDVPEEVQLMVDLIVDELLIRLNVDSQSLCEDCPLKLAPIIPES